MVGKYADAFGAYDYPGVFYVRRLQKEVIGIEFRNNDQRIKYPTKMKSLELDASFYYSVEIDDDAEINLPFVKDLFEEIAGDDDAHRPYSDLCLEKEPEVIAVFHGCRKFRILHEWKIYNDRAIHVMNDDYDQFQKEELYRLAFTDHITGNYNWIHLEAFLEVPGDRDINDYALSLLKQMPIDTLKIDKSFVDTIAGEAERNEDVVLLRHIITLAKELGFVCLAEGAENRIQIDRLRELGCEIIQGYYYSKPIPLGEYEEKYL